MTASQVTSLDRGSHRAGISPLARRVAGRAILYLLASWFAVLFMIPFFWTISSSLKKISELYIFPPTWVPEVPQWVNYLTIWRKAPLGRYFLNSCIITGSCLMGSLASSSLVGYSFARFRYPGRDAFFLITLSTMMLPVEVTLIPTYLIFNKIGWTNSFKPLIIPSFFGGGAFSIFLMRQFFMTIPRDLDESARIDGANFLLIFARILLPLAKPVLATAAVIGFIAHWNDFLTPLIFLDMPDKFTIAIGLKRFQAAVAVGGERQDHLLMAASLTATFPLIVLFFLAQRYFVRGVVMSGIKG
ncbi:MAG: carbohydrate ABC transporter permease [Anaerolineae bacterium]|nr:carbohydrate ABC transporter permease [Anaerolineae bacterium]